MKWNSICTNPISMLLNLTKTAHNLRIHISRNWLYFNNAYRLLGRTLKISKLKWNNNCKNLVPRLLNFS